MTQLLDQAISRLRDLSPKDQDAIAALILSELEDERRWDMRFEQSQDRLADLARKARNDIESGKTREIGFDAL